MSLLLHFSFFSELHFMRNPKQPKQAIIKSKHEHSLFFEIVCKIRIKLPQKRKRIKENAQT